MSNSNETYAAVDLGSNSFHMVVANIVDGRAIIVDRLKEMVRLAGGLDEKRKLTDEAISTALSCLEKFGQRIKSIPSENIRAVGTNTLRQARNSNTFLSRANQALGHKIEIISGREEARLIYLGVANTTFNDKEKRLVVDIGGGSTELIIGKGFDAEITESLFMGCVSISKRFFADDEITHKRIKQAHLLALQELENIKRIYRNYGWDRALGSSGTIKAIRDVIFAKGWSDGVITSQSLDKLKQELISIGQINKLDLEGLSANRKPVFVGGVIVLSAVFDALKIEKMEFCEGALREGLLYDQIDRQHEIDIRDRTIERMMHRYSVETEHAKRVEKFCKQLFKHVRTNWELNKSDDLKMLRWSACLHEIGLAISHSQYHKHASYILSNSDMPGFSRQEQNWLSILVRTHRRKISQSLFNDLNDEQKTRVIKLIIILRLSVIVTRSREEIKFPEIDIKLNNQKINLIFPVDWLDTHPLTSADLESEVNYLRSINYELTYC